jgi:hypothetical protein
MVIVRVGGYEHPLDAEEVDLLVGELERLESDRATRMAVELRALTVLVPEVRDLYDLMRALEHLRNLKTIPSRSQLTLLRDRVRGMVEFGSHRYRLDPLTGEQPFESASRGPLYEDGDRFVDVRGHEWFVERIERRTDPIEIVVAPWKPRAERF